MNPSSTLVGFGLMMLAASVLSSGCASSGQTATTGETPGSAPAQAGGPAGRRNSFVLTSAEIAASPGLQNAYEAVQALRPHFLRARGAVFESAGGLLGGGRNRPTGRSGSQGQGGQSTGFEQPAGSSRAASSPPEDVGILVYLDRQRYGRINTLREIPVASIEEIRFLNVGEANSQFGMGHPHGVIQIITRRGPSQD